MRFLIFLFILFGQFTNAHSAATPIINLDSNLNYRNLGKSVTYYEDKSASLTLQQMQILSGAGQFKPGKTDILNLGNTKSAMWIRLEYTGNIDERNYMVLDVPNIEQIDFYVSTVNGLIHKTAGSIKPPSPGVTVTNNFIFDLPIQKEAQSSNTIWLRLKTNNILIVPIKMATSENFAQGKSVKNSLEVMYIGILLTLFLFNLFLYFSIKDRTYLYYCFYVFSIAIYVVTYLRGYSYLFGYEARIILNLYPHIFISISLIASILFSQKLLNLKTLAPEWTKICNFLLGCCILMFFTSLLGFKSISATLAQIMSLVCAVVLWYSGVVAYRKGHKQAKYYLLAWSFISVTVVAVVLSMAGVFTYHEYTFEFVPIGSTIELLLLAFALGDRYRVILTNEQKVRDENFLLIQTQNQRLEKLVEERTIKLTDTILQLESSNAVKNKLFSIIAHDLRSPFNSLMSIFSLKDMNLLSLDELKMLLNENKKNIDTIHNTLNNLLYWAKSQMEGIKTQPTNFNLKELVEDLRLVYSPLIQSKGITINLQYTDNCIVYADENQIQLVLRNLIDNAIKFTPASHSIGINMVTEQTHMKICVSNTVSNANELNLEGMSNTEAFEFEATSGTGNERGIGLGLHLCREYIKSNGSELHLNINDNEVAFCFELPLAYADNTILA
ncbi:sensor histidine kinase [Pedobacter nyackensis]|uniref:sensor histidine kinase n=1 Tax=Pedobacter nyackensis TaxID=475255 RepID=UPI00292FF1F0|nr:sensor histidine kinase [Pedobacter nyackensis]